MLHDIPIPQTPAIKLQMNNDECLVKRWREIAVVVIATEVYDGVEVNDDKLMEMS